MKVLMKKEVYESCEQCTGPARKDRNAPVHVLKKKRKEKWKMLKRRRGSVSAVPKRVLSVRLRFAYFAKTEYFLLKV